MFHLRQRPKKVNEYLQQLSHYYKNNRVKANPSKTVSCTFHLNNRQAGQTRNLRCNDVEIEHDSMCKYVGVTLDRTLSFKQHCNNVAAMVQTRNNLSKLTNSTWSVSPHVMRTTALAMCYSVAEYACPVWLDSVQWAKTVDIAQNETCRKMTGCIQSTPTNALYKLAGIAPLFKWRKNYLGAENSKQESDPRHPLYVVLPVERRLKSRYSFLNKSVISR